MKEVDKVSSRQGDKELRYLSFRHKIRVIHIICGKKRHSAPCFLVDLSPR